MALAEREDGFGHYRSSSTYCASTIIHIRYSGYISLAGLECDLALGGEYPSFVLCRHENEGIIPNICYSRDDIGHQLRSVRSWCGGTGDVCATSKMRLLWYGSTLSSGV